MRSLTRVTYNRNKPGTNKSDVEHIRKLGIILPPDWVMPEIHDDVKDTKQKPLLDIVYEEMTIQKNMASIIMTVTMFLKEHNTRFGWAELLWAAQKSKNKSWIRILETVGAEDMNDLVHEDEYEDIDNPLCGKVRQPHNIHHLSKGEEQISDVFHSWKGSILPKFNMDRDVWMVSRKKRKHEPLIYIV